MKPVPQPEPYEAVEPAVSEGNDGGAGCGGGGGNPEGAGGAGGGAIEGAEAVDPAVAEAERDPLRFNNWMKRSTTGAVMTGIAIGLREALEPRRPEVAFVIEASDPNDPDGPIDLRFDPDSPQNTVAVIRRPPPDSNGETPPA